MPEMQIFPMTIKAAMEFLKKNERHYKSEATPVFAIGIAIGDEVCGAVVVGEREGDAELAHIYSVGEYLGYTILYGAAWRASKALGYKRMVL